MRVIVQLGYHLLSEKVIVIHSVGFLIKPKIISVTQLLSYLEEITACMLFSFLCAS